MLEKSFNQIDEDKHSQHYAMLEKSFNQIDEDKRSQHYATLNRGRRGGCFNDLCHWLYMI